MENIKTSEWTSSVKDWHTLDEKSMELVANESEKYLQTVIEQGHGVTDKTYYMIGLYLSVGGIITKLVLDSTVYNLQFWTMLLDLLVTFYIIVLCYKNIRSREIWSAGFTPELFFTNEVMRHPDINDDERFKYLTKFRIEVNQRHIHNNLEVNRIRIARFDRIVKLTVYSSIATIVLLILTKLI